MEGWKNLLVDIVFRHGGPSSLENPPLPQRGIQGASVLALRILRGAVGAKAGHWELLACRPELPGLRMSKTVLQLRAGA